AMADSIVIESDGKMEAHEDIKPPKGDLISIIREAGIVGLGGAAFPTHIKLSPPKDKKIDTLIINGAECEPYLTGDHRIIIEEAELVLQGINAVMKHLGVSNVYLGSEDNKREAIDRFKSKLRIIELKTKYPQGGERQLIKAITGREVPSGGLPYDIGVVVLNVGTCAQIAKTLRTGMPLIERVVTVTGKHLKEPKNLRTRIGTLFSDLIDQCGGMNKGEIGKVVAGGPMMGVAVPSLDVPIVKGTSGILVMTEEEARIPDAAPCIRCAKCVDICPQYLLPNFLGDYSEHDRFDQAKKLGAMDCIECGACSYVCPTKRHLVQLIKLAKLEILKK
ncbi:MAG: electron transport complex subunit RsxC, partial [Candidatus Margulisiibacteriota bacterium]